MLFDLVPLILNSLFLVPLLTAIALIARRVSGGFPETEDHPEQKQTLDSWICFCVIVLTVELVLYLPLTDVGRHPPHERFVQNLHQIDAALADCAFATGSAPTRVSDLKTLRGTYLQTDESLDEILDTGKDYWGNPLVILPVHGKPGRFTLRSTGPNGKIDAGLPKGDDIVVTYTAFTP